jgi:hypothetical protein
MFGLLFLDLLITQTIKSSVCRDAAKRNKVARGAKTKIFLSWGRGAKAKTF